MNDPYRAIWVPPARARSTHGSRRDWLADAALRAVAVVAPVLAVVSGAYACYELGLIEAIVCVDLVVVVVCAIVVAIVLAFVFVGLAVFALVSLFEQLAREDEP